ncbi:EKC/KEOPS complex subunit Pcc1p [Trichomonascus vanleenenianus]|uniref:chromatin DNA-binding EKC/KEOPS complex subunit PCC1 n=1 Tax=Trichomonascus vanleenenianus TaxID=2268995 RepID=UPI003EC95999
MLEYKLSVDVPFISERQAYVAIKSLSPDPELRPDQFRKTLTLAKNVLHVEFEAASDRSLRVGVNGFFDSLNVVIECIEELNPETGITL